MEALVTVLTSLGKWLLGALFAILLGIGTWAVKRLVNTYTKDETNDVVEKAMSTMQEKMAWRDEQIQQQTNTMKEIATSLQLIHSDIARIEQKVEDTKDRMDRSNI